VRPDERVRRQPAQVAEPEPAAHLSSRLVRAEAPAARHRWFQAVRSGVGKVAMGGLRVGDTPVLGG
jgi:hypothetical protein